jgi:plasmid stabilization system protein ParE
VKLNFKRAARREFDESCEFYESRESRLGTRFASVVERVVEAIETQPDRFAKIVDGVREAPVMGFPFAIYYKVKSDRIEVISVFHTSRDPSVWQDRAG